MDAENLDSSFKAARDTNGELALSFSDVVDAIHIVQTDMGITGTTAKEAESTIQGSIKSMNSAWSNWLTSLADEDANVEETTQKLVDTAINVITNAAPIAWQVAKGLGEAISNGFKSATDKFSEKLNRLFGYDTDLAQLRANVIVDPNDPEFYGDLDKAVESAKAAGEAAADALIEPIEAKAESNGISSEIARWFSDDSGEVEDSAKSTGEKAADAVIDAVTTKAGEIQADAETPVSAFAKIMDADISMQDAGIAAVERTGSDMKTAVLTSGFDGAGQTAMQQFINGINSMSSAVMAAVNAIAAQAAAALRNALAQAQAAAGAAGAGSYAIGLDYVPYNDFPAVLHKGEAVLTSSEAEEWRNGKSGGNNSGITIVQNINSVPQTPVQFAAATAAAFEQARWGFA